MFDLVKVGLRVDSRQVKEGRHELDRFGRQASKTQKSTDKLSSSFKSMIGPVVALVSATASLNKLVDTARQFDVINASLITVTGSTEKAGQAFEALQAFAATTPFALTEVTDAFVKMKALGLDPSSEALTSYGNTASAMGKSLNQLVEAVADASTGEFERLKEFGIRASSQGDQVAFTFQGVTKTVQNNSQEIQRYLREIGETEFAGAMERRADSLDGALSNLGDTWDNLFLTISNQGVGDLIEDAVRAASDAINDLDVLISSGAAEQGIAALGSQFYETGKDIENALNEINRIVNDAAIYWGWSGETATSSIVDAFKNMPANIRAFIKLVTVEIASFVDETAAYGELIAKYLNPKTWIGDNTEIKNQLDARLEIINEARNQSIKDILDERDAIVERSEAELEAARVSFEAEKLRRESRSTQLPIGGMTSGQDGQDGQQQDPLEKLLRQAEFDEMELERASEHKKRMLEVEMDYYDRLYNLQTGSQQAALDFSNAVRTMDLKGAIQNGALMIGSLAKTNKTLFKIQKGFALANALVTLPSAVMKSYENGGGYPFGIIPAGLMLAKGLQQINAIRSSSFEGPSSPPSPGGGSGQGTAQGAPVASGLPNGSTAIPSGEERQTKEVRVTFEGDNPHSEAMRTFAQTLSETLKDMGTDVDLVTSS